MKYIDSVLVTDSNLSITNVAEDDYAEWDIATAYVIGDRVISTATHSVYQCLVANTGNDPDAERVELLNLATADPDPQYWGYVGYTNPWRMFDRGPTTYTTKSGDIVVTLDPGTVCDGIALYGLTATSVRVVVNDSVEGDIYDETYDLTLNPEITNIWEYFTVGFEYSEILVVTDLPGLYPSATITVTISNTAGDVSVGEFDFGSTYSLGETLEEGTYFSRLDTSTITTDTYGQVTSIKRPVIKISNFRSEISKSQVQTIRARLDTMKGSDKRTFIGSDNISYDAIAFGYIDSADVTYEDANYAIVKLRVIGVL